MGITVERVPDRNVAVDFAAFLEEAREYADGCRIPFEYTQYTSGRFGVYRRLEFDDSGSPLPNAAERLMVACAVKLLETRDGEVVIADIGAMFGAGLLFVREAIPEKYRHRVRLFAINEPGLEIGNILAEARWRTLFTGKRDFLEEHAKPRLMPRGGEDYDWLIDATKPLLSPVMLDYITQRLHLVEFIQAPVENFFDWVRQNMPDLKLDLVHEFAGGIFHNCISKSAAISSLWKCLNPGGLLLISRMSALRQTVSGATPGSEVFLNICSANPKDQLDDSGYFAVARPDAPFVPLIRQELEKPVITRQLID